LKKIDKKYPLSIFDIFNTERLDYQWDNQAFLVFTAISALAFHGGVAAKSW
jgi:hypothetical protein